MRNRLITLLVVALASTVSAADKTPTQKETPAAAEASEKATAAAKKLTPTQEKKLLEVLNKGDEATLTSLPGIGESKAAAIKKARPFAKAVEVTKVEGIGDATFEGFVTAAKDRAFPANLKPAGPEKKAKGK